VNSLSAFTRGEVAYLSDQPLARLATASKEGEPDASAVGFSLDGVDIVSGGLD
jgi:pyridoxamine 5'-phosphate oxidase family protein